MQAESVAHTSSKHALAGFTAISLASARAVGIQVFGIAPGAVKTGMTAADFEPGGLADWAASETPIKRWMSQRKWQKSVSFGQWEGLKHAGTNPDH